MVDSASCCIDRLMRTRKLSSIAGLASRESQLAVSSNWSRSSPSRLLDLPLYSSSRSMWRSKCCVPHCSGSPPGDILLYECQASICKAAGQAPRGYPGLVRDARIVWLIKVVVDMETCELARGTCRRNKYCHACPASVTSQEFGSFTRLLLSSQASDTPAVSSEKTEYGIRASR